MKYIVNHNQSLAIFTANSKLQLIKIAKTIFASHYILLKGIFDCRDALATTIVLNSWKESIKYGNEKKMGALIF